MKYSKLVFIALVIVIAARLLLSWARRCQTEFAQYKLLGSGNHDFTLQVGELTREYRLYEPPTLEGKRGVPLVIVLHGGGQSNLVVQKLALMDPVADEHSFLVAYPNGIIGPAGGHTWNAGDCCGPAMEQNVDDVGFISLLIDTLVKERGVNPSRVYVTGISNGAMMVYRLVCELSNKLSAAAPISGTLMLSDCEPAQPVPLIIFHGTADRIVPMEGGGDPIMAQSRRAYPRTEDTLDFWIKRYKSRSKPKVVFENGDVTGTAYNYGSKRGEIVYYKIEGGGHTWPGGINLRPLAWGRMTRTISADEMMWTFFASHPKR
jgi:polyhydroxybutyrate depolymerase